MDVELTTPAGITVPAAAISWRFSRASGPGGQGVNTTDSRVELIVDLTAIEAEGDVAATVRSRLGDSVRIVVTTERSQLRNREEALERLVARLEVAATPERPRRPTRPTRGSVAARLDAKRLRGERKAARRAPGDGVDG